jgi:hypothetical protein
MAVRCAMIRHRPAGDLAAVEVHDRGQIKPALISLNVGDVGEPDPVRRGRRTTALDSFLKCRSIRSRSLSRRKRAISAAWSAKGSVTCVVGRRDAAIGSRLAPICSTHAVTRNRPGEVPWPPIRSSGHTMQPDQPLAACSRP